MQRNAAISSQIARAHPTEVYAPGYSRGTRRGTHSRPCHASSAGHFAQERVMNGHLRHRRVDRGPHPKCQRTRDPVSGSVDEAVTADRGYGQTSVDEELEELVSNSSNGALARTVASTSRSATTVWDGRDCEVSKAHEPGAAGASLHTTQPRLLRTPTDSGNNTTNHHERPASQAHQQNPTDPTVRHHAAMCPVAPTELDTPLLRGRTRRPPPARHRHCCHSAVARRAVLTEVCKTEGSCAGLTVQAIRMTGIRDSTRR